MDWLGCSLLGLYLTVSTVRRCDGRRGPQLLDGLVDLLAKAAVEPLQLSVALDQKRRPGPDPGPLGRSVPRRTGFDLSRDNQPV